MAFWGGVERVDDETQWAFTRSNQSPMQQLPGACERACVLATVAPAGAGVAAIVQVRPIHGPNHMDGWAKGQRITPVHVF